MINSVSKILVVDDERINVQLLFEALSDNYTILAALTGAEALIVAKEQIPDLILLDIMLEDMDGYAVCEALKNDPATCDIPIIFVTGRDKPEDEVKGLEMGAVDYFRKPISVPLVRLRVSKQIELAQKTALLEHLSSIDGLTGVANRRQFDERLSDSIRYADRNHRGISLLMLDIDYFKQYNDTYGHVKGDEVLKKVATTLQLNASRPMDFVARYGGEEFAILLVDASPDEGHLVAEKIRTAIEQLSIEHKSSDFGLLTVSIGVTHIGSGHLARIDCNAFIDDADHCLYMAKQEGRNRTMSSHLIID